MKVDRTSMINSLEVRCPFLDLEAFKIIKFRNPFSMISLFKTKKIKKILKNQGLNFLNNHKKRGFSIPLEKYLLKR